MSAAHTAIALAVLTGTLLRRLLRQGIVMRSLTFPIALTALTLLATLGVVALTRTPPVVAATPELLDAGLRDRLEASALMGQASDDPRALLVDGTAAVGTDGDTVFVWGDSRVSLDAEAALRRHLGASWVPNPGPLPRAPDVTGFGTTVCRLLCAIFALYGVVFGAGMVARDRDDGTLEVELALPVPRWTHGAARLLAGTAVLWLFLFLAVALYDALSGVEAAGAMIRHGLAGTLTATGLGLITVGTRGLKAGFAASLALGLSIATGLLGLGWGVPAVAPWLPLSSILSDGAGWVPLAGAAVVAVVSVAVFTLRSARA